MKRQPTDRAEASILRPVEKIELSWKNYKLRIVAVVVLLAIAVTAFVSGIKALLTTDTGWQTIAAQSSAGVTVGDEFVFLYNLGAGSEGASRERRGLNIAYTNAARKAYELFNADQAFDGTVNLYTLNGHPNEIMTVDPALYGALETLAESGDRNVYLGPIHEFYDGIYQCEEDRQTADFDPLVNRDLAEFFGQIAAYARDPDSVRLELPGEDQVRLFVSEDYLAFAQENGIGRYLDLSWMRNAFAADYLADCLTEAGYTYGSLTSFDGYARNLDADSGTPYSLNVFGLEGGAVRQAGRLDYTGALTMVSFRAFPMSDLDQFRVRVMADGSLRGLWVSPEDGLPHVAADSLVLTSDSLSCAETLLRAMPLLQRESLQPADLLTLPPEGAEAVLPQGGTVWSTDAQAVIVPDEGWTVRTVGK